MEAERRIDAMCQELRELREPFISAFVSAYHQWIAALPDEDRDAFLQWSKKNAAWMTIMGIYHSNANQP